LSVGGHTVTAAYSGDTNFTTSTSPNFTQTVNKANTSSAVASSVNPSVFGQSVTLTASVSVTGNGSGTLTGTVNFRDGGTTISGCGSAAVNGSAQATCSTSSLTVGNHTITAVYSGDTNFNTSTSPNFTQTVNKASTSTA